MNKKYIVTLFAALIILSISARITYGEPDVEPLYYARVDYILKAKDSGSFNLNEGGVAEISAPPEPAGYRLLFLEAKFGDDGLPQNIVPVIYDHVREDKGTITSLISYSGEIKIACKSDNASFNAVVEAVYIKTTWLPITGDELKVNVEEPDEPFNFNDMVVKITIENFAPFAIGGVTSPSGLDLLSLSVQEQLPPEAVEIDPKHLYISGEALQPGVYHIKLLNGEKYVLPSAFIAIHERFNNETVGANRAKTFNVRGREGWEYLGSIVILYSLGTPRNEKSAVNLEAQLVDYVYFKDELIHIDGASFLIPPLDMKFWLKAFIVFGDSFKVENHMASQLSVIYIPIMIKKAGEWTPEGVFVNVKETNLRDVTMAYAVVQLPSYGTIEDVVTPSGESYGEYASALKPWYTQLRSIGVNDHEAFIQVKSRGAIEAGQYFFKIDWKPITILAVDSNNRPLKQAVVEIEGPTKFAATTDNDGRAKVKLYIPGEYKISVKFSNINVGNTVVGTLTDTELYIKCKVYELKIVTQNALGQALSGTEVSLILGDEVLYTGETNDKGVVVFEQVPKGAYIVQAVYKRIEKVLDIEVVKNEVVQIKLDMLFEIPYLGFAVSTFEAVSMAFIMGAAATFLLLFRRGGKHREETEAGLEVEEYG
ncbi:MAG TPA: hypothetical protein ENJ59_00275 [Thermofilum sp.]|nr:hypothetical protein [Thermofilum sp.]